MPSLIFILRLKHGRKVLLAYRARDRSPGIGLIKTSLIPKPRQDNSLYKL
jgi:hypothetical protein